MDFEGLKEKLVTEYGDEELAALVVYLALMAKQEGRDLSDEELLVMDACSRLYGAVRNQMQRLSAACLEPVVDPASLSDDERNGLLDYFVFERGDEKIAARANLVKLHEPIPEGLTSEEHDEYFDNRPRATFVPLANITVREAFNCLEYWKQEAETDAAIADVLGAVLPHWEGVRDIAQLTGDKPPETLGEYADYMREFGGEEEEEHGK